MSLVGNGFPNLQSCSDILCWSLASHSSEIQLLAQLPCRQRANLQGLVRAPRRDVGARPCCTPKCGCHPAWPPTSQAPPEAAGAATQLGCQGPPGASSDGDRCSAMAFSCLWRCCCRHGCRQRSCRRPCQGQFELGVRTSPRRGIGDCMRRLCRGAAARGSAGSAAQLCPCPAAGPMCARGSERAGTGQADSGQVRPPLRPSRGFGGFSPGGSVSGAISGFHYVHRSAAANGVSEGTHSSAPTPEAGKKL